MNNNDIDVFGGMDHVDHRDYRAEDMQMFAMSETEKVKMPDRVDLFNTQVKNQKRTKYCSSYGGATASQVNIIMRTKNKNIEVDAEAYWDLQQVYPATGSEEVGDYIFAPCKSAVHNGVPVIENGVKRLVKAKGYARVNKSDFDKILSQGNVLLSGAKIFSPFTKKVGDDYIYNPTSGEYRGGHLFAITGYDPTHYFCVNSWGEKWGKKGTFKIKREDAVYLMSTFVIYF